MSTPHSSADLRAHVDAVLDPHFEVAFGVLDAIQGHLAVRGARRDRARIVELQAALARLDVGQAPSSSGAYRAGGPAREAPRTRHNP